MSIDALSVLYAQLTRDLLAIAKFLLNIIMTDESETFVIKSRIYMVSLYPILLILLHRRTIFKMFAHE